MPARPRAPTSPPTRPTACASSRVRSGSSDELRVARPRLSAPHPEEPEQPLDVEPPRTSRAADNCSMAAPRPPARRVADPRFDGVERDVPCGREQLFIGPHAVAAEPPLKDMPAAAVPLVECLRVEAVKALHACSQVR